MLLPLKTSVWENPVGKRPLHREKVQCMPPIPLDLSYKDQLFGIDACSSRLGLIQITLNVVDLNKNFYSLNLYSLAC